MCQVPLEGLVLSCFVLPIRIALPSVLRRVVIWYQPVTTLLSLPPDSAGYVDAPQKLSHSGLLEPLGSSTVRKAPGVRDKTTWSVKP